MAIVDIKEGDTFELVEGAFHSVRDMGEARKVRWIEENDDGTVTVCTTHCGETYTLDSTTLVKMIV